MSDLLARGWPLLVAIALAGLVALALAAAVDRRDLAFSPGVPITRVATDPRRGETACQRRICVRERFEAIELVPRWLGAPGPPALTVAGDPDRRVDCGRGDCAGRVRRQPSAEGRHRRRCAAAGGSTCASPTAGRARVGIEGGEAESAAHQSPCSWTGPRERRARRWRCASWAEPRSVASQLPVIFERAALFRPGWVGPWTFWALALVVGLGVPALLARALAAAVRDDAV